MLSRLRRQHAHLLLVVLFTFTLTPLARAQAAPDPLHTASPAELAIVKVLLAQETAWNRGDIDGFAGGYKDAPDTIFVTKGISRGHEGLVEQYRHDYPTKAAMGTLSFSQLEVHSLGE